MKILNLFAGLGGNRSAWGNSHKVVAVEINIAVARIYKKRFPNDKVIVKDAIRFLMNHFPKFDFIWISPECKSHSSLMRFRVQRKFEKGYNEELPLPDLNTLYGPIIFLQFHFKGYYVVENVNPFYGSYLAENVSPYYEPFIKPTVKLGRHYFWSNFPIPEKKFKGQEYSNDMKKMAKVKEIDLKLLDDPRFTRKDFRKDGVVRDMVNPKISAYIMECLLKHIESKEKE